MTVKQATTAILGMWFDMAPQVEADFHEWHNREHMAERLALDGFRRGRRYKALSGQPKFFFRYDLDEKTVAISDAYLARLNDPTEWTRRLSPNFKNFIRTVAQVTERLGAGIGSHTATLRLSPATARRDGLRDWLTREGLPAMAERPGVVGAELWETDIAVTSPDTAERRLRGRADNVADWVIVVDGIEADSLRAACSHVFSQSALRQHGAAGRVQRGLYRLLYSRGE